MPRMTDPIREQATKKAKKASQNEDTSTASRAAATGTARNAAGQDDKPDVPETTPDDDEPDWFSPEQEASLLAEANEHKAEANALFARGQADAALTAYETAVAVLPAYLYYDLAVLRSNMAACHLKLSAWQEAIRSATQAVEALDKKEKTRPAIAGEQKELKKQPEDAPVEEPGRQPTSVEDDDDDEVEEEIVSEGAAKAARPPPPAPVMPTAAAKASSLPTERDRLRIRAKALLRRGRARAELGGWANLAGAEEDYKALAAMPPGTLGDVDRRLALKQIRELPARTSAAKDHEMGDMMGKLKELGNGLLRPFGISTDNFQMVKDEKTGGYSMNFRQGP
ncbi:tetratricopeptide repeat protein 1 [Ophiostoma piceae UAMH 11346]|uniref:Tetratricopeptide repeat protein 1 n=1 Tax=Ophiostoma piceae (strain UAMH 11346) TaxID=1262450 RepID=S3CF64_OPHP1|nr:tetratricopeptide repeat protein 1 [Ophiostoma piceae UAMH 11346]